MVHMDTYGRTVLFGGARAVLPYPTVLELDDLWRTTFVADQLPYGSGCGSPPLTLSPSTTAPRLGATWQPTIGNVPPVLGIALVAIGLSRSSFGGAPLPQSLTPLGWNGCDLLQDLAFAVGLFATPAGAGTASLAVPIPPLPQMAGYRLYAQAWAPSPGANPAGFIVSGGLSVVIGD